MSRTWRTALVTGSTGFIGRHLVRHLASNGIAVTCLQRGTGLDRTGDGSIWVDALASPALDAALLGKAFDVVFHLAAYGVSPTDRDADLMSRINVEATATLARIASEWPAQAMIVTGSGSEYSFDGPLMPAPETRQLQTKSLYGITKSRGSDAALAVSRTSDMAVAIGRLFNVYGPGEAAHRLLPSLIRGMNSDGLIALSAGTQVRDFLHVDDAVAALCVLADLAVARRGQHVLNVCSGQALTVRQFCEAAADAIPIPRDRLRFGALPMRLDDVPYFVGDPSLVFAQTHWRPVYSLQTGLAAAVAQMRL
jgi:UDP-glucose 4-epimerase